MLQIRKMKVYRIICCYMIWKINKQFQYYLQIMLFLLLLEDITKCMKLSLIVLSQIKAFYSVFENALEVSMLE